MLNIISRELRRATSRGFSIPYTEIQCLRLQRGRWCWGPSRIFMPRKLCYNFLHIDSIIGAAFPPKRHQVQSRLFHWYGASQSIQRKETNCGAPGSAEFFSPHGQFNMSKITEKLKKRHIVCAPHPAYAPDLSPCDFWLFGILKQKMKEQVFQSEK
jgi:hypothetical protein